jgi:hypothetical protein
MILPVVEEAFARRAREGVLEDIVLVVDEDIGVVPAGEEDILPPKSW